MMSALEEARCHALRQIDRTVLLTAGSFPHYTEGGTWVTTQDGSWTGGMWVGQLWIAYQWSDYRRFADAAMDLLPILERRIDHPDANFDVGFLLVPSFVEAYCLMGDDRWRQIALRGARRMVDFFHEKAGLFYTIYPDRTAHYGRPVGTAVVDILMNLHLLWWAGEETGDPLYHDVARRHGDRTLALHVREDGSTYHAVDFDLEHGAILHSGTIHGYRDDSTWSRGQAWGLHGFTLAYQATYSSHFCTAAERLSDYFIHRLPSDARAYWDLSDPKIPDVVRDTSASAISATAWLKMENEWAAAGRRCLESLAESSLTGGDAHGILGGSTAYKKQGRGIHQTSVWGDYYFLQGLAALTRNE